MPDDRARNTTTTKQVVNGEGDASTSKPERTPLLQHGPDASHSEQHSAMTSVPGHDSFFFENVAEGMQERDRQRVAKEMVKYTSFVWAVISWYSHWCHSYFGVKTCANMTTPPVSVLARSQHFHYTRLSSKRASIILNTKSTSFL